MESEDQKSYFRNAKINRGLDCIIMAIVVALLSIALAGCGGGGASAVAPPTPVTT